MSKIEELASGLLACEVAVERCGLDVEAIHSVNVRPSMKFPEVTVHHGGKMTKAQADALVDGLEITAAVWNSPIKDTARAYFTVSGYAGKWKFCVFVDAVTA